MVNLVLRKQFGIVDKDRITKEDVWRVKVIADVLNTVRTFNEYHKAVADYHRTPMQNALREGNFGIEIESSHEMVPKKPIDIAIFLMTSQTLANLIL